MPSSTRIKGKALSLMIGATEYACDATSIVLDNEEADDDTVTFCEVGTGGNVQWFFTIEAVQSTAASSFWRYLWENTGTEVAFVFKPHGNETASADQPHFTGNLVVGSKPSIGGEAAAKGQTFTFETRLDLTAEPVLDEGL